MSRWDDPTPAFALDRSTRMFRISFRREPLGVAAWLPKSKQWVVQDVVAAGVDYVPWIAPKERPSNRLFPVWLDRLAALLYSRMPQVVINNYWERIWAEDRRSYGNWALSVASRRLPSRRLTQPRIYGTLPQEWVVLPGEVRMLTDVTVDVLRSAALAVVPQRWRPRRE